MTAEQKMQEILENEELLVSMVDASTPDELMEIFASNQIILDGLSKEEAFKIIQQARNGELGEDDLDNVSGGAIPIALVVGNPGFYTPAGLVIGGAILIGVAGVAAYTYYNKKKKKKKK